MSRIAARVTLFALVPLLLASLACGKTYHLKAPAWMSEEFAKEIAARRLHEGDNLLIDLKTHKLFGEIRDGELQRLRLEIEGEKPEEVLLGALARTNPAPPLGEETPMSCAQKYELCYSKCRRTVMGTAIYCCFLQCDVDFMKCEGVFPGSPGGGFVIY